MMAETCLLAEASLCYPPLYDELRSVTPRPTDTVETVAIAAVAAAAEQNASALHDLELRTGSVTEGPLVKEGFRADLVACRRSRSTLPLWKPTAMRSSKAGSGDQAMHCVQRK